MSRPPARKTLASRAVCRVGAGTGGATYSPGTDWTEAEQAALDSIAARVPPAVNLCGKTSIAQLASLARMAQLAVGNDTGPMHVIAATGCPSTVLFSHASNPERSAPVGAQVTILREQNLSELTVDRVLLACERVAKGTAT